MQIWGRHISTVILKGLYTTVYKICLDHGVYDLSEFRSDMELIIARKAVSHSPYGGLSLHQQLSWQNLFFLITLPTSIFFAYLLYVALAIF